MVNILTNFWQKQFCTVFGTWCTEVTVVRSLENNVLKRKAIYANFHIIARNWFYQYQIFIRIIAENFVQNCYNVLKILQFLYRGLFIAIHCITNFLEMPGMHMILSVSAFHHCYRFTNNDNAHVSHSIYSVTTVYLSIMSVYPNKFYFWKNGF